jgi:hypothetical protein
MAEGVTQVGEHLSSKHEAMSLNLYYKKRKRQQKEETREGDICISVLNLAKFGRTHL